MQESLLRPDVVSIVGFAELAGLSVPSIRQHRRFGLLPDPLVGGGSGKKILWRRADAEAWVQANRPSKVN
jgi:hypothetical protein